MSNKKLYNLIDESKEQNNDAQVDTNQLAQILDTYMTETLDFPSLTTDLEANDVEDLEIESNNEVDLIVDEEAIIKEVDNRLSLVGDQTLLELQLEDEQRDQELQQAKLKEKQQLDDNKQVQFEDLMIKTKDKKIDKTLDLDKTIEALDLINQDYQQKFKNQEITKQYQAPTINDNEKQAQATQTIISPDNILLENELHTDEIFVLDDTQDEITKSTPSLVVDESNKTTNTINLAQNQTSSNNGDTIELENFQRKAINDPSLLNTINLGATMDDIKDESINNSDDIKPLSTKEKVINIILIIVIIILTISLIYMLFNK